MNIRISTTVGAVVIGVAMTACNAYPRMERDFGNSVRHLVQSQAVVTGPVDTTPVEVGDGDRLNTVLEVYRSDVSRPEQQGQPVTIDIGSMIP